MKDTYFTKYEKDEGLGIKMLNHGIRKEVILQTFYQDTLQNTKYLLDAVIGGHL